MQLSWHMSESIPLMLNALPSQEQGRWGQSAAGQSRKKLPDALLNQEQGQWYR